MAVDRISPITSLLDEVFYQSSIKDMRSAYFHRLSHVRGWFLLSDYYLETEKTNKVVTFSAMPSIGDFAELQNTIRCVAPQDFKHTRAVDPRFIELLRQLPVITISFVFQQDKYFAWSNSGEFQEYMAEFCDLLSAYVEFWRQGTSNQARLDRLSQNTRYMQELLHQRKKIRLLCEAFVISLLGGYVGSLLGRETALTDLCWLSDRDRTNELGENLIRDLFQIILIDVLKRNISFSFTSANSSSDEWYADATRIPDMITGAIADFDFNNTGSRSAKAAAQTILGTYLRHNRCDCFIYRFLVNDQGMKIQRMMVVDAP